MGVIRGFFLVFVSSLLFISIFSSVLLLTISSSLQYPALEKEAKNITKEFLLQNVDINSAVDTAYPFMQIYCQTNQEYTFNEGGFAFTISCDKVSEGKEAVIDDGIESFVKGIYYKEYGCEFVNCFKSSSPLVLFSKKAYDFFHNLFTIVLVASLAFLVLVFFLIEKKSSLPILTGSLLVFSSLPLFKMKSILTGILNMLSSFPIFNLKELFSSISQKTIESVLGLFFSTASKFSVTLLVAGFVLIFTGIIWKVSTKVAFLKNFFSKFKKTDKEKKNLLEEKKSKKTKSRFK